MMNNDYFDQALDLSKVRDRGSKKWVAMMLPEHLKLVDEWDLDIIQDPYGEYG
ncbi:hypothetical protein ACFVR1_11590 [Psychrobacillus sp. NPDC058041]|uniref:hypothetical protein n=1 Tax=Psychrobacillus sp. NPDC058041 TaxID=3346310 RepID=UPI0036DACF4A